MKKITHIFMVSLLVIVTFATFIDVNADDQSRLQVIHVDGGGTFTVSGGPYDGLTNYSNSTSNFIDIGTSVTLTATPDNYHNFKGWYNCQEVEMANNPSVHTWETVGNALSTNASYQFELTASYYNIMPVFETKFGHNNIWTYGSGTVAVLYENRNAMEEVNNALDGNTYQGSHMVDYIKGDQITVKAKADANNVFAGWYVSNVQQGPQYYDGNQLVSESAEFTYTPGVTTVQGIDEPIDYLTAVFKNTVTVIDTFVATETEYETVPADTDLNEYVNGKVWTIGPQNAEYSTRWFNLFGEENGVYSYPKAGGVTYVFLGQNIENGVKFNHYRIEYTKVIVTKEEQENNNQLYVLTDGDYTTSFTFESGHNFVLNMKDVLTMTPQQILDNYGMDKDTFDAIKAQIVEVVKQYGNLISIFDLTINDGPLGYSNQVELKIKLTDEMKQYNTFKFIYLDENNNFKIEDIVDFRIEGDYLIANLPHLSAYALVGSNIPQETTPNTGDNILFYIYLLGLSAIGLTGVGLYTNKRSKIEL